MASIGGLAAGIAHEINNPLGFVMSNFRTLKNYMETIKNYLELTEGKTKKQALKKKIDFIIEDMDDLFKESAEGFERILLIIENMRQFSRVNNENNRSFINLNNSIKNTLVIAKNSYKYVSEVITQFSELPEISCNQSEINQVLLNIIANAAQAIEQQQTNKKGMINIRTYLKEDKVCCEIVYNGPDIPEKYINKVFDPFFTTKEVGKGTGMGLSISYDIIVNKHKGELKVSSIEGSGTTFTIKLPMSLDKNSIKD